MKEYEWWQIHIQKTNVLQYEHVSFPAASTGPSSAIISISESSSFKWNKIKKSSARIINKLFKYMSLCPTNIANIVMLNF